MLTTFPQHSFGPIFPKDTQSKSYMLSLADHTREFHNNAQQDTFLTRTNATTLLPAAVSPALAVEPVSQQPLALLPLSAPLLVS